MFRLQQTVHNQVPELEACVGCRDLAPESAAGVGAGRGAAPAPGVFLPPEGLPKLSTASPFRPHTHPHPAP